MSYKSLGSAVTIQIQTIDQLKKVFFPSLPRAATLLFRDDLEQNTQPFQVQLMSL